MILRLVIVLLCLPLAVRGGVCVGADPCLACKDCSRCAYCTSGKGSCGVVRNQDGKAAAKRIVKQRPPAPRPAR